jgi:hypothetical protein
MIRLLPSAVRRFALAYRDESPTAPAYLRVSNREKKYIWYHNDSVLSLGSFDTP